MVRMKFAAAAVAIAALDADVKRGTVHRRPKPRGGGAPSLLVSVCLRYSTAYLYSYTRRRSYRTRSGAIVWVDGEHAIRAFNVYLGELGPLAFLGHNPSCSVHCYI